MTLPVSLILPTFGDADLLDLYFRSLAATARADHQVVVVCHDAFPPVDIRGLDVKLLRTIDGDVGVGRAQNRAIEASDREYIAISNDDIVFLPEWDDLDGRVAEDRWLGWELLEPGHGSFPPAVEAGRNPSEFRWDEACRAASLRNGPSAAPGGDAGLFLFHRSLLDSGIRYENGSGPFAGQDTDFMWRIFRAHPRLLYGRLNLCLYHFGGVALSRRPGLRAPDAGEAFWRAFTERHGLTPHEAHARIRERTSGLLSEEPRRWE